MYEVIFKELDMAGKTRVRVAINGESITFKFQSDPTDEEIQAEAARYDAIMQEQADAAPNTD